MADKEMRDGPRPKRRRLSLTISSRSSSPDELSTTPYGTIRRTPAARSTPRGYSFVEPLDDESPDELNDTFHTFRRGQALPPRSRPGGSEAPSSIGPGRRGHTGQDKDIMVEAAAEDEDDDEDDQEMHTPRSRLSPTPGDDDEADLGADEDIDEDNEDDVPAIPREKTPREKWKPYRLKMTLQGHKRGVAQARFSPDGRKIASCSADATIRVWDVETGKLLHTLEGHLAGVSTVAWSPDSETLASGSDDKSIRLWNTSTGKPYPVPFVGHHNYVYSIAFSPKGNMIVSGSYDEAVFLWDVRGARVMRTLPAHSDPVGGVDFVPDGTLIVSCAGDGLIRIWDTATGQCLRTLVQEDREPVTSVVFSPNGKFVLAWTLDSCLRLWNYVDGKCMKTYQGHKNVKYNICGVFGTYGGGDGDDDDGGGDSADVFVASGSEDGRILLWDVTTKEILQTIDAHDSVVLGVDHLFAQGLLVSAGIDGTVKVWEADPEALPSPDNHYDDEMND